MLSLHFTVLTIFGIWCRARWSQLRKIMHTFYAVLMAMIMCSLWHLFQEERYQVRDDFEENIKKTYDRIWNCRMICLGLLVFVEVTILIWMIGRTIGGIESRQLPYEILQSYDLSNPVVYCLSYVHHMLAGFFFTEISLSTDATVTGFMLQLYGQVEILEYISTKLHPAFTMMTIFGIWCPAHWSQCSKIMYKFYTLFIATIMFSMVSMQLARLVFVNLSFDEFNDTFYFFLSTSSGCFKLFSTLVNRDKMSLLSKMFQEECCHIRNSFENNVKRSYDRTCKAIGVGLLIFVELTIVLWLIARTHGGIESRQLPYKIFQPYDLSDPLIYWLSYVHHMLAGFLFAGIGMISDSTITGFMLQLCGQLEILRYRLQRLPGKVQRLSGYRDAKLAESCLLKETVMHHVHIYNVAEALEATFNGIISVQFFVSSLEICVSVYQLTIRSSKAIDLFMNVFFIMCMLGQLSIYCYFGHELATKSINVSDALYKIDWMELSIPFKKNLTLMILRSSKPIEISSGVIVHLTMGNFTSVVKFAYSVFNFLKCTV